VAKLACGMYRKYTLNRQITAGRSNVHTTTPTRILNDTGDDKARRQVFKLFPKTQLLGGKAEMLRYVFARQRIWGVVGIFLLNQLQSSRNFQCNLWSQKRCHAEDVLVAASKAAVECVERQKIIDKAHSIRIHTPTEGRGKNRPMPRMGYT